MIDSYEAGKINEALKTFAQSTNNQSISMPAEVLGTDEDGTTWVQVIGGNEKTPLATSTVSLSEGDMVNVTIGNGRAEARGNLTDPSASSTSLGRVEATANEAYQGVGMAFQASEAAQQAASEAQEVAEAVNQHFWYDTNGAHVTDATQEAWEEEYAKPDHGELANPTDAHPWYNQLLGSAGTLLRSGLKNLASWTRSAIAFYDGAGNAAENIVAQFGASLARIGKTNSKHIAITNSGFTFANGEEITAEIEDDRIILYKNNGDMALSLYYNQEDGDAGLWITDLADYATFYLADGTTYISSYGNIRIQSSEIITIDGDNGGVRILGGLSLDTPLEIWDGGTGANNEADAWINLGGGALGKKDSLTIATTGVRSEAKNSSAISANGTATIEVTLQAPANSVFQGLARLTSSSWSLVLCGWNANNYNVTAGAVSIQTYWRNITSTQIAANGTTITAEGTFMQKTNIS